jgi:hydroxyacylglutathione hydrolase
VRLTDRVYLVGSGSLGFDLTDPLDSHVYLIDGGTESALVDTGAGMGVDSILEMVTREGLETSSIRHVILTHGHGDHAGGAAKMRQRLTDPIVYSASDIADFIRTGDETALSIDVAKDAGIYPSDYAFEPCEVNVELGEGDKVEVGDLSLTVLETPGHSDGHISLSLESELGQILLAGDVIFVGGRIMLTTIHDCRIDALVRSLRKLRELDVAVLLPGHFALSMHDGQRHIERANEALDRLLLPESAIVT